MTTTEARTDRTAGPATADGPPRRVTARVRILLWLLFVMAVALASVATTTLPHSLKGMGGRQVLSREQILSHVWGYDFDPGSNIVDVYVRTLRRKLGAERLETVRGMGYRLPA